MAVQSQICGALTVKNSFFGNIRILPAHSLKRFNIHAMLIATLSCSKFESIQLQLEESAKKF